MSDDESVMSSVQLDECLSSFDRDDVTTARSRDRDDVTDDNVADWILSHSDVTSGHNAAGHHRPVLLDVIRALTQCFYIHVLFYQLNFCASVFTLYLTCLYSLAHPF